MTYYGCGFTQDIYPAVDFSAVSWRTDLLLPAPRIVSPRPDSVVCLNSAYGSGSNIYLEWSTVAGATHYVVQWSGNAQVSGPDVRETIIASPTTVYELIHGDDIRLGEDIYWRVFAINRTSGGSSSKSEPRKLTFNCNSNESGKGLNPCTDYDVQMVVNGTDYLSCCDENVFWLELTFACKDQFDRELIQVDSIEWSVNSNPDDENVASIKTELSGGFKVIVESHGTISQVIEICAEVTFVDNVVGGTFTCNTCKKVFLDCDTPFTDRPWSPFFGTDTYNRVIAIHYDYLAYEPMGLMMNPDCGCDTRCITPTSPTPLGASLGDMTITLEVVELEICTGDTLNLFFADIEAITETSIEIEVAQGTGAYISVFTGEMVNGVNNVDIPITYEDGIKGCDVIFHVRITRADTDESVTFDWPFTGEILPESRCLYSDQYIVIATGPVFKIPIRVCDGIETDCCDCTPERLSFTMGPTGEEALGELIHNSDVEQWRSTGSVSAFGCDNFLGPAWMYCQGETWVFQAIANCDDCNPIDVLGCSGLCIDETFSVDVEAFEGINQIFSRALIARHDGITQIWEMTQGIKITPPCGGVLHLVNLRFSFDSADQSGSNPLGLLFDYGPDNSGWTFGSGVGVVIGCDPLLASTSLTFVKGGCDDLEIVFELNEIEICSPCSEPIYLQYDFYSCGDPWDASFDLYDPALPDPIHIHIYDWVGTECGENFSRRTDVVALEARVNIPVDPCFFVVRDGMLSLNLESLLGPGLGLGYRENGCPYIYVYGGFGGTTIYYETLIYCCYSYGYGPDPGGDPDPLQMNEPDYPSMSQGVVIVPFSVLATGGVAPYMFAVQSGTLPAGLSLNASTGEVTGTPTTYGTGSTVFEVTDDNATTTNTTSRPWTVASNVLIADPTYPDMEVGTAIVPFSVVATYGVVPYIYSLDAGSLPAGLSINSSTGQVTGTPTTISSGTSTFMVEDDAMDTAYTSAIGWAVVAAVTIADPNYPAMETTVAITPFNVVASNGFTPYAYSVFSGALPTGLSLNSGSGQVSGTPTVAASGSTVFRVTDDLGAVANTSSRSWTVTLILSVANPNYPSMEVGTAIVPFSVVASGGDTPYAYSVQAGSLPAGLSLNSGTGEVTGTPTTVSSGNTTFRVTDDLSDTADTSSRPWAVVAAVTIADPTYPAMTKDVAITPFNVVASNGVTAYAYSVFAGSLPAGLSLNSGSGQVSGTPTTVSSANTTFRVTDALGAVANTASIAWSVTAAALDINDPTFPAMQESTPITPFYAIGSGGTPAYTYSIIAGALPDGVTLNTSTGEVSGTPTTFGTGAATFRVTDTIPNTSDSSSRPWTVTF